MRGRALRRLSPVALVEAVRDLVEDGTGLECTMNPDGKASPFYGIELVGSAPAKSKTMRLEAFSLLLHCISVPSETQLECLGMVNALEEAMEAFPCLTAPFRVVRCDDGGVQQIKRDETGEWHAVVAYTVTVSYGLIIK